MMTVLFKSYPAPEINRREIIRYMGAKELSHEQEALLDECLLEILPKLVYRVCWCKTPVKLECETVDLGFASFNSEGLLRNLSGCEEAFVFAATVGLDMDRAIAKYSRLSPVKGLMMQAIGAERIESLCDAFNSEAETWAYAEEKHLRPRFSPGYGDFPLEAQRDIFKTLDCARKIGLTLNDSLLMSPTKSVTAIIGVSGCPRNFYKEKCSACGKVDCTFRKS